MGLATGTLIGTPNSWMSFFFVLVDYVDVGCDLEVMDIQILTNIKLKMIADSLPISTGRAL